MWTFHGEAPETWSAFEESQRHGVVVIPGVEIRFAAAPDRAALAKLAELVERIAPATGPVLWSGAFSSWQLPGKSLGQTAALARTLATAVHAIVPVREVVFLAAGPLPALDPGPAWPGASIRAIDRALPEPATSATFDRARAELRAARSPMRLYLLSAPADIAGLADAIASRGTSRTDADGVDHAFLRVTRIKQGELHDELGLVATGAWAFVKVFATEQDMTTPRFRIEPVLLALGRQPQQRRSQIADSLRQLGLATTFPDRALLLEAFERPELPSWLLAWLGPDLVPLDADLRALLGPHRSDPKVAAVLDAKPAKKKPKR